MRTTRYSGRSFLAGLFALLLATTSASTQSVVDQKRILGDETRSVDVVICLDTSGSMEDLLDSSRARIWDVVNELARMKPTPELRVGLLSFGSDKATEQEGWILRHLDLTEELDPVYAELMSVTIGGEHEYVGRVLNAALDDMSWSPNRNALRVIFLAGNESADQDVDHDFRVALQAARDQGIIVNSLYAGNREQGIAEKWLEVAQLGKGNFSAIDPQTGTLQIPTPQDELLLQLNARLNTTYVPYGPHGKDGLVNQVAQDSNASRLGVQSCSSRIVAKGGALYTNASWDLVDAALEQGFDWDALSLRDLPEPMQSLSREAQKAFVDSERVRREQIQQEIERASDQREAFLRKAHALRVGSDADGLGDAMRRAIREQAMAKGFTCDGC